jgi:hypothetical protein
MQGQFEEALRCVDESFSIFTALDDDLGVHWAFVAYSKLLARHGQLIDALRIRAAVANIRPRRWDRMPLPMRSGVEDLRRQLEAAEGPGVAHAVWAEGQAMTMAELNAFVRSVASRTAPQLATG